MISRPLYAIAPFMAIAFVVVTWASSFVAIRYDMQYFSPGGLAFTRYLIASVIMLMVVIASGRYDIRPVMNPKGLLMVFVSAMCGVSLYNLAVNDSEQWVNAGLAAFIINQAPLFAILLSVIYLKERLQVINIIGLIIATVGVLVIFLGSRDTAVSHVYGMVAAAIAALLIGMFTVVQRPLVRRITPILAISLTIWVGTLFLAPYMFTAAREVRRVPLAADMWALYLGVIPAALAYVCWCYALSRLEVKRVMPAVYTIPLLTALISMLFLDEAPTIMTWVGGLIALAGSYFAARQR